MSHNQNNPAPNDCDCDPFEDPNFDLMGWVLSLDFPPSQERVSQKAILHWLTEAGFADIKLRPIPERGELAYQAIMARGTNRACPNGLAAQALLQTLAVDLGYQILDGESCGLVWGDQVGVAFRLQPPGHE